LFCDNININQTNAASYYKRLKMKLSLLFIAVFAATMAVSQPKLRLYGFAQAGTPGMIPVKDRNENGQPDTKIPNASIQYFIFTGTPYKTSIIPEELWINGTRYKVKSFEKVTTPVLSKNNDTLIKQSNQYIQKLIPWDKLQPILKASAYFNKLIANNELLLKYKWNKKTYYATLKKLIVLETEFGE
jgi:hypothetical protein